ncbi:MAG TPA: plastocyanin/azurin family copper-binding protein [Acidimicrobiia bacterium]|jgi:plastocyanin|nr:plastocyanin/azurin family copper-binding protein [Acidimicrobiia bacterium]
MKRVLVLVATMLAVALLPSCGSSKPKVAPPQPAVDYRGKKQVDLFAEDNLFSPAEVIVSPGTKVTWHNSDQVAHNIKKSFDALDFGGPFGADVGEFGPGATYSFTFKKLGTNYYYSCTIHTGMNGRVRVEKSS